MQKISADKMDYFYSVLDVRCEVGKIIERNQGLALRYHIRFTLQDYDKPLMCLIDPHRFEQVISNLLSNAAKFSPPQQHVVVKAYADLEFAVIAITDFGSGIKDEFKKKIFQRFSQADSSDTRENGGTGLGLHISKSIIDAFHGQLSFDSEVGKGTTFYVRLPLVHQKTVSVMT